MTKILIVDDSNTILVDLKAVLEGAGYNVATAINGNDCYSKAESEDYFDMIISDFNMPGMDGLAMIQKIKKLEKYAKTPFVMLTTESSMELKKLGKEAGVVVWFVKPVAEDRILSTLTMVFEKFPPRSTAA
ncbi:MAG TPA: response regulator [Oligoflexus sp.]|uniref:response regulator n=1 Tax=Oligoflexus sp. TaxID=1971216 RepID=UPI002D2F6A7D|nr:response regulator [Oligoflexus sp.]HYX33984.1 response regulator [Oligoflexus sp.]